MSKIVQDLQVLRQKSVNVENNKEDIDKAKAIILELKDTVSKISYGVGLGAIQIGTPKKIAVIKYNNDFLTLINPELIEGEDEFIFFKEGCLSLPNKYLNTKRYKQIQIKNSYIEEDSLKEQVLCFYYDKDESINNDGLVAIAIQHELDHMDGKIITDFEQILKPEPIIREDKKIGRNEPCICGSGLKYKKCCGK